MKGIGLAIIFIGCTLFGIWKDQDDKKRIKELERFIYLFECLKGEISYQLTPLVEACTRISEHEGYGIKKIFNEFVSQLERKESIDLRGMWQNALRKYKGELHLCEADIQLLLGFGEGCDYLDQAMQERNLELLIFKMRDYVGEVKRVYEKQNKLNKSLGALIGAGLVIVLI